MDRKFIETGLHVKQYHKEYMNMGGCKHFIALNINNVCLDSKLSYQDEYSNRYL